MTPQMEAQHWELERLRVLYALARKVLLAESLRSIADEALEGLARLLAPWRSSVGFIDERREHFTVYLAKGSGKSAWEPGISIPLSDFGADLERLSSGEIDIERDLRRPTTARPRGRIRSSVLLSQMITPITFEGELVGTLNVGSDRLDAFGEREVELASEVVELVALAFGRISRRDEIIDARELAESRSKVKSAFVANMSHEIRTPLNAVIGASNLLRDEPLPESSRPLVEIIHDGGEQLLGVVSNILDLSKLEAGGVVLEQRSFSLREVLRRTTALVGPAASKKGLHVGWELPDALPDAWIGDESRLRQVLTNLLSNAVKFTARGRVLVRAAKWVTESGRLEGLRLSVEDTGEGIAPDRHDAVLEPFAQADASTTRRHGGTGLGLPICREIVRMMGGELALASTVGQGSTFTFEVLLELDTTVPASPRPAIDAPARASSSEAPSMRVLIAEDNVVNQRVLEQLLLRLGYHADLTADGAEALAAIQAKRYGLVLMDIQMPTMDGLEASRQVQALGLSHPPRIVALTASATTEQRQACLRAGMQDFITKPVRDEELQRVLADAARRFAERDA